MMENFLKRHEKCRFTIRNGKRPLRFLTFFLMLSGFTLQAETISESNFYGNYDFVQTQEVTGTIVDENNTALPGASVIIKGTSKGAVADFDGNFTINVPDGATSLVVSYIGYKTMEVPIQIGQAMSIQMEPDASLLDEVVVTGYGSVKRNEFVGATSVVKAEGLVASPVTSVEQGMRGQLAGVQVTQSSGQPGAGISVRIRGLSSFAGGNEPLYVIDGIPLFNDDVRGLNGLSFLNPNDIESIEVLKDASSTSIYGSRAANGVVQVTTKGGRASDGAKITFNTFLAAQQVRNKYDLMNGEQFINYATEYITNAVNFDADQKAAALGELQTVGNAETDWQDEVFQTGFMQSYNLSFTGGNQNSNYFVSANLTDQTGVVKETDFKRISLRSNLNNKLNDFMNLSTRISLSQTASNGFLASNGTNTRNLGKSGIGSVIKAMPTAPVYDAEGNFAGVAPYSFSGGDVENPVGMTRALDRNRLNRAQGVLSLNTKLAKNFTNVTRASVDYIERKGDFYSPSYLTELGSQVAQLRTFKSTNTLLESFFNYNKTFGELEVDALAGASINDISSEDIFLSGTGFPDDILQNNAIQAAATSAIPETFLTETSLASFFTRVRLNYKKKYLISLDARTDGSSVFSAGNKWAGFGAFGAAWRISEEEFLQGSKVNELKLRFSTGSTGNQAIQPYQSLLLGSIVLTGQTAGSGISVGLAPNLPNGSITWETTTQTNFGVDFGLDQNKYRLSFDVYKKTTDDLLAQVQLPPSSGFRSIIDNVGKVENTGFEIQAGLDIVNSENWTFAVDAQFSKNDNVVVQTKNGEDILSGGSNDASRTTTIVREGESLFSFYEIKFTGMVDGQPTYEDFSGPDGVPDGEIDGLDRQVVGNSLPDFSYGFNTNLRYKKWNLISNWQGVSGNGIQNTVLRDLTLPNLEFNKVTNTKDFYPATDDIVRFNSDRFIEDGSYLRMANIKLSYNINVEKLNFFDAINIYASGQNLITITDYSGFDPEVNSFSGNDLRQGSDLGAYPTAKTFTLGLNLSF